MDFLYIEYRDQVPWAADSNKIALGSVLYWSNYGHCFINVGCCDISEKNVVIYFIFGRVIRYKELLMLVK